LEEHDAKSPGWRQVRKNALEQHRKDTLKAIGARASRWVAADQEAPNPHKRGKKSAHAVGGSSHKTRAGTAGNSASGAAAHRSSVATAGGDLASAGRSLVEAADLASADKSLAEAAAARASKSLVEHATAPTPQARAAAVPRPVPSAALTKLEQLEEDKAAAVRAEDYSAAKSLKG
jgi:hypothetical protein